MERDGESKRLVGGINPGILYVHFSRIFRILLYHAKTRCTDLLSHQTT